MALQFLFAGQQLDKLVSLEAGASDEA